MTLQECQLRAEARWLEDWGRGPTRTRWIELPLQVGDAAPDLSVLDSDGRSTQMATFWAREPALLLFWRHFGCGCGRDRNERLKAELSEYGTVNVVIIGQGEPEQASAYAAQYGVPVPIYSDPERRAYDAYGLLEGLPEQIFYDATEELIRRDLDAGRQFAATRKEQGRSPVDSPWQLPGEFIVDSVGRVRLAYRYQYCEDFPDPRILNAVLRGINQP